MDFKFSTRKDPNKNYKKTREDSILDFQYRIFDLVTLDDIPIMEKINFIKIINSNLEEFITVRLQEVSNSRVNDIIYRIEDLYMKLGASLKELNEIYKIDELYEDTPLSKKIIHKDICKIYSGENFQSNIELNKMASILYSEIPPKDQSVYKIRVPKEIILIKEYEKLYKEKFKDETFDRTVSYEKIDNYYNELLRRDIIIRNPYDSYQYVTDFIDQMCTNKNIKTIFITLYRTSENSVIIKSLLKAITLGKRVYVYVEPFARGNEQSNLENVNILRKAGAFVRTNYFNYKIHSKIFCAIDINNKKFVHIGTGNYNEDTAKFYTDTHLLTTNNVITNEALYIILSIFEKDVYKNINNGSYIYASPTNLRSSLIYLIEKEILKKENGKIYIKCNNLYDENIIDKLYQASAAGVDVKIICRTVCGILPKKNIEIRSKVGQYLEHDRIYIFGDDVFISSADLYTRNISKRVEILCGILQPNNKERLFQIFDNVWNSKHIHQLQRNGEWKLM